MNLEFFSYFYVEVYNLTGRQTNNVISLVERNVCITLKDVADLRTCILWGARPFKALGVAQQEGCLAHRILEEVWFTPRLSSQSEKGRAQFNPVAERDVFTKSLLNQYNNMIVSFKTFPS